MIPVEELREYVKATAADDAILEKIEAGAVAFVERMTGRYFGTPEEVTEILSGPIEGPLFLLEAPAEDPALALEYFDGSAWGTVDVSSYSLDGEALWAAPSLWVYGSRNYRVTYTRGYASGVEPPDVRQLVMDLASLKWNTRGSEGMESETIGGYSYTRADLEKLPFAGELLASLRRLRV